MTVLTHDPRSTCAATKVAAHAAPPRNFWARVFDSIVAARMRRAEDTLHIRGDLIADLTRLGDLEDAARLNADALRHWTRLS